MNQVAVVTGPKTLFAAAQTSSLSAIDDFNLFSAASSIILAIVALYLSLYFYRRSVEQARLSETSANQIASSVDRLERLFNSLYADTFSMMRDTVSDMRAHIWPQGQGKSADTNSVLAQADATAIARIEEARRDLMNEILSISKQRGVDEVELGSILNELTPAIDKALGESSEAGAERTAKMAFVVSTLKSYFSLSKRSHQRHTFADVVREMRNFGFTTEDVQQSLLQARDEGWASWTGPGDSISAATQISFTRT